VGRAHVVEDPDEVQRIRRSGDPDPWASGPRHLYVSLVWRQVTGVRLEQPRPKASGRTASEYA
jgi:hypothetical protein